MLGVPRAAAASAPAQRNVGGGADTSSIRAVGCSVERLDGLIDGGGLASAPAQRNVGGGADNSSIREVDHSGKPLGGPGDRASAAQTASAQGDDGGGIGGSGSSPEHKVGTLAVVMVSSESVCKAQSGCIRTVFKVLEIYNY